MSAWAFNCESLSLVNGTRVARLTRKAGDVLACLVRNHGRVVSQDQLLREVWPNLHVTPDLVREYISDLRSVMGDDARAPTLIETVRGRGYRLCVPVNATGALPEHAPMVRVAVLGLSDRSADGRLDRLARGIADDTAAELSRYPELVVIARDDSAPVGEGSVETIARGLGVRYAVAGKVDLAGDILRVLVNLINASTGQIVWTRRIRVPLTELPLVSEEVAATIAGSLGGLLGRNSMSGVDLVRRKPTATLDAYEHYLLGCDAEHRHDRASMLSAVEHLEQALALDSRMARCWLVLSYACGQIAGERLA